MFITTFPDLDKLSMAWDLGYLHTLVIKVLKDTDLRILDWCFHLTTAEEDDCEKYEYEDQQAHADPDDHQERLVLL